MITDIDCAEPPNKIQKTTTYTDTFNVENTKNNLNEGNKPLSRVPSLDDASVSTQNLAFLRTFDQNKELAIKNHTQQIQKLLLNVADETSTNASTADKQRERDSICSTLVSELESFQERIHSVSLFCSFLTKTKASIVSSINNGYFCVLPTELIFCILSNLEVGDLARCCLVNHDWHKIASDDQMFRLICQKKGYDSKPEHKTWKWVLKSHMIQFEDPVKSGCGTYHWPENKGTYIGEWDKNNRQGYGVQKWNDSSIYKGEWLQDFKHGFGTMTWADGQSYTGEWANNRKEGRGVEVWADGRKYVGEYKNSNMDGLGTYTWPGGDCYVGEWKDDNMHGYGTYTWPNGSKYQGHWAHDEHNGYGKYTCGHESYEGEWRNNYRHGRGKEIWGNGVVYDGHWKENKKHGDGIFFWPDKDYYKGRWQDGRRVGVGALVINDRVYYQKWDDAESPDEMDKGIGRAIEVGSIQDFGECENLDIERILKRKQDLDNNSSNSAVLDESTETRDRKKMKIAEPFVQKQ